MDIQNLLNSQRPDPQQNIEFWTLVETDTDLQALYQLANELKNDENGTIMQDCIVKALRFLKESNPEAYAQRGIPSDRIGALLSLLTNGHYSGNLFKICITHVVSRNILVALGDSGLRLPEDVPQETFNF